MKKTRKSNVSKKEIAWYVIALLVVAIGLSCIVFHFVGDIMNSNGVSADKNGVYVSAKWWMSWSNMNWLHWGLIITAAGVVVLVATLAYNAKKTDRDYDKEQRRLQRLESITKEDVVPAIQEAKAEDTQK